MGRIFEICTVFVLVLLFSFTWIKGEISDSSNTTANNVSGSSNSNMGTTDSLAKSESLDNNPTAVTYTTDELIAANIALASRIAILESRLHKMEGLIISLNHDVNFHHPTTEIQYVDMQVVQWEEALKNGLRHVAIPFKAGFSLGAVSSWEFSLDKENGAVTVNLLLIEEQYDRGALFAGFTVYVLNAEGNVYSEVNALPVNFLDGTGRTLHLPNVITLDEIRNSSKRLSEGDVFKIRFRLEMFGVGHKLYSSAVLPPESPPKDVQTVVFDVEDIMAKFLEKRNTSTNDNLQNVPEKPLAYTSFLLKHDQWLMDTVWTAELHEAKDGKSIAFHVILDHCAWPQLYASFNVEVWDSVNKKLIQSLETPINNFIKDKITIDPLLIVLDLEEIFKGNETLSLQFKLQFVVYGQNARYYTDVV